MEANNVIALGRIVATNEPVEGVIKQLEELLERAKAGEVRSLAWAYVDGGGYINTGWHDGTVNAAMLIGAVSRLQWLCCRAMDASAMEQSPLPPEAS